MGKFNKRNTGLTTSEKEKGGKIQKEKNKYQITHKSQAEHLSLYRNFAFCILQFAIFIFVLSSIARADVGDFLSIFHPSLTVQEEYTDNLNLTSTNRQDEWITTISPGLKISTLPGSADTPAKYGIDLDYRLGLVFYAHNFQDNYISHSGALNTWFSLSPRLTFRLRDYIVRSQEPRERAYNAEALPEQFLLGTQRERSIYIRNAVEPSVAYQFGKEDRFELNYRNMIYQNQSSLSEDSQENYINPRLTYWFNIRNGIILEYGFTHGDFEKSPDFDGHMARGRYTYRFNPRTSTFVEYTFTRRDFDPPSIDYDVNNPSLGFEHAFTPTLTGRIQVGYFWQKTENGSSTNGFSYNVGLTQSAEKTTYTLSVQGGYTEDYFTAENLGFTKYHTAIATISHRPHQRVTLGVSGSLGRTEYASDRKDWIYRAGGNVSLQVFRWLSLSLEASHSGNDSNTDNTDYIENRAIFRINAAI
jgi:hypothetical protein